MGADDCQLRLLAANDRLASIITRSAQRCEQTRRRRIRGGSASERASLRDRALRLAGPGRAALLSLFSLTYILGIPDPIRGKVRRPVNASTAASPVHDVCGRSTPD